MPHLKGVGLDQDVSSADTVSTVSPGSEARATNIYCQSSTEDAQFSIRYQVGQQVVCRDTTQKKCPRMRIPSVNVTSLV